MTFYALTMKLIRSILVACIMLFLTYTLCHWKFMKDTPSYRESNIHKALVAAKTKAEDIRWIHDTCSELNHTAFIYTTETPPESDLLIPRSARGREAAAYLSFIIDYYHELPAYSIFIHANQEQWHNDLFGPRTRDVLRHLRYEAVDAQGYVNLRCMENPGCPISANPLNPTQNDISRDDVRAHLAEIYMDLFAVPRENVPKHIGGVCCAQFAVSRKQILRRPRTDYERMLRWVAETQTTDDFGVGWVMEKVWHIVFGMEAIYCPQYNQCRCDNYGWCGPLQSGDILTPVAAARN
ncbi:uncharacterized protein CIMG_03153 [Coccidioides immitis RS]|uniref:Uncharacterized protein n=4 Tax=Coccidioides immitis TaxID=5501 RepID=J3KAR1_COCIM|nr:uncharacterized protein CIMG_03153 [Coccidioides immitis RS]EAS32129.3 hypothetical protein CIMG_03153 [Coccidioides immitis RS]KMP07328.1 hypothetical protein CIRG_07009 [Coccidioides immitis RMSCC 2394]KMU72220.1 hypothetical protein CISG_00529 [Coccidioides immitis RMSCC 3703]KMU82407.1 hypothetical protein CIHG_00190 [Coccidioides immitis H538.4]